MTLSEILQASELAVVSNGEYAWPSGSLEPLGSEGVLLNGSTLSALGIKHVKTSWHELLEDQYERYDGFKIGGEPIVLSKVGTQPHSGHLFHNHLIKLSTPSTFSLYRNTDGTVQVVNDISGENYTIGAALSAPFSTRQRNVSFIIVHICGAGGGGGGGGGVHRGKGGGSGSILVALIDIRLFSQDAPLVFEIGAGGSSGEGKGVGEDGEDGKITYVRSKLLDSETVVATVFPGKGGDGGSGNPGSGGGLPTIPDNLDALIRPLLRATGNPGNGQYGGILRLSETYTDPTREQSVLSTSRSFPMGNGNGGNGGDLYVNGVNGQNSSVYIYY